MKSFIHIYFKKISQNYSECNECFSRITSKNSSTTNMRNHLKYKHKDKFQILIDKEKSYNTIIKNSTLNTFIISRTKAYLIEEDICRLIFEDNITINQLNESKTLKKFLKINSNNKIYESNNSIKNLIVKNAITIKNYYNNYIKDLIQIKL